MTTVCVALAVLAVLILGLLAWAGNPGVLEGDA